MINCNACLQSSLFCSYKKVWWSSPWNCAPCKGSYDVAQGHLYWRWGDHAQGDLLLLQQTTYLPSPHHHNHQRTNIQYPGQCPRWRWSEWEKNVSLKIWKYAQDIPRRTLFCTFFSKREMEVFIAKSCITKVEYMYTANSCRTCW